VRIMRIPVLMQTGIRAAVAFAVFAVLSLGAMTAQATDIQRVVSPGGIEAWLVHETSVPVIAIDFAFRGGSNQDPTVKPGVAYQVAALLDEGAGELDGNQFHAMLQDQAIELSFRTQRDYFHGSLRVLGDRRDQGFEMLRLSLNEPRFEASAIERIRAQVLTLLRRETTSPNDIATRLWWRTAFPSHPYGLPTNGTLESAALISAEDLRDYKRRVLARDNLKVAVVGDIDPVSLGLALDRIFGALPAKAELTPIEQVSLQGLGEHVAVEIDVPQTVLLFGGRGVPRKDPDYIPAFIANHVLGGGSFSSRLYKEVRDKRGLAYTVYSSINTLDHTALATVATATRADRAAESVAVIEAEIRQLAEHGITQEELDKTKSFLKGSYALRFDTSAKLAGQLLAIQLEDLGIDYITRRNGLIDAVTLEDTQRAAKRLFEGGVLVTIVGKSQAAAPAPANQGG
jgi:zinc protease